LLERSLAIIFLSPSSRQAFWWRAFPFCYFSINSHLGHS
jgi:hypothetical protein